MPASLCSHTMHCSTGGAGGEAVRLTEREKDWFLLVIAGGMIWLAVQDWLEQLPNLWLGVGGVMLALYAMGKLRFGSVLRRVRR